MRAGSAGCVNALRAAGAPLSLQAVRVAAEGDTLELLTLLLEGLAVEDLLQVLASAEEEGAYLRSFEARFRSSLR